MSNILQTIFRDHYEELLYLTNPRQTVIENVDKMIDCGNPAIGGTMYSCECGYLKFVPFRCHSRFCPSCGNMYSIKRTTAMSFKLINCTHRHCVFTIPEELRPFFLKDRSLLNCLFEAVNSVFSRLFFNLNKSVHYVPGFICVLHTFGRSLQWNPHIHCLITELGIGKGNLWRKVTYFNYKYLRNSFRTTLLNILQKRIGSSFKKVKAQMYRSHENGFYVYAKPNHCVPDQIAKYIGRYLGRPVIATSRIDAYDGENVTYHYNRHEDDKLITVTLPALDFMKLLVQHIPEKHFKMIRYYGLYARHRDSDKALIRAIHTEKHTTLKKYTKWRYAIFFAFGYDPLICPLCGKMITFCSLKFKRKPFSLPELYERAFQKYRCGPH